MAIAHTRLGQGLHRCCSLTTLARRIFVPLAAFALFGSSAMAQLSGSKNIPGDYPTLAAAITDLNTQGVGAGGVTLNVLAGNPETAPAGGYVVGGAGSLVLTTTSAANQVIIQGNGNTITASGALTAGALTDAIFKLIGADWITIQNFTIQENAANTTTAAASNNMTEWGVALLYASTTDGAQNNTVQNNTISLNRSYTNTWGIYSNTRHSATAITTTADITNNTTAPNSGNKVYGNTISNVNMGIAFIGSGTGANQDVGNDVGGASAGTGNIISNWGGAAAVSSYVSNSGTSYCIFMNHQVGDNVSFNTLTSATISGTAVTLRGIFKDYTTASATLSGTTNITNNTITITDNFTSGTLECIRSQGTVVNTSTANINSNSILNTSVGGASSSTTLVGIINSSAWGTLNMNNNVLRGNTSTATTGGFTGISNTGAIAAACNIKDNQIGNASGGAVTFSAATSGTVTGINCATPAAAAPLTITGNDIRGITHSVAGTSAHTYITWGHAPSVTDNISNNTFTNLNVNTTGSVTFMTRTGNMTATGVENCNSNLIVTAFNKSGAGGTITFFGANSSSVNGSAMTNSLNNFSNVTVTGATTIAGWSNTEGASSSNAPTKTVTGNTFSNITGGSSAVTAVTLNFGNATTFSTNTISNIVGTGAITGVSIGSSNGQGIHTYSSNNVSGLTSSGTGGQVVGIIGGSASIPTLNISNNTINNLSSTGTGSVVAAIGLTTAPTTANISGNSIDTIASSGATTAVAEGILVQVGTTVNVFKNKICNISRNGTATTSGVCNGIRILAGTTVNVYNNLIGNLFAPAVSQTDAIRGISVLSTTASTTYNLFYNTVFVNASSTGTDFGTSGIFQAASATATTAALNLRNNVIVNTSTANGTGLTVAHRRSSTALANYSSTSNNNLFYAGTPGLSSLIFYDGTNSDQTIGAYQARVSPRDAGSFTENPTFLSTSCSNPNFLHLDTTLATQIESGGAPVTSPISIADDFDGDVRNATTPDIGADEFNGIGIDLSPPTIAYTPLSNTHLTGSRTLTATITDATGVPTSGIGLPVLYWRVNAGAYSAETASYLGGTQYQFTFGSGVTTGDVVSYYVVAQDTAATPNVGSNPGGGSGYSANPPATATPPSSPNSYSILGTITGTKTIGVGGDYATLTDAIADFNNKVMTRAVTFLLTDASYPALTSPIVINANPGSSAVNTLTIKPATGVTTTISGSIASGALIKVSCDSYVTIDGSNSGGTDRSLTLTNTSTTSPNVVWFGSCGTTPIVGNTLKNCVVINGANTSSAVVISDGTTAGNPGYFADITVQNNSIQKAYIGVYANGGTTPQNGTNLVYSQNDLNTSGANAIRLCGLYMQGVDSATVSNNNLGNFESTSAENKVGIWLAIGTKNAAVSNNTVSNLGMTATTSFASFGINVTGGTTLSGNTLTRNSITNISTNGTTSVAGIAVSGTTDGVTIDSNDINGVINTNTGTYGAFGMFLNGGNNHVIKNNFISNINHNMTGGVAFSTTFGVFGIGIQTGTGHKVYHNSVNLYGPMSGTAASSLLSAAFSIVGTGSTNCDVRDNIFANNITGGTTSIAHVSVYLPSGGSAGMGLTYNNNAYYFGTDSARQGTGQAGTTAGTNFFTTLAALKGYTSTLGNATNDNASLAANTAVPFQTATDLHLVTSPPPQVSGAGVTIASVPIDIDGDSRKSPPDIGADEIVVYTVSYDANGGTGSQTDANSPYAAGATVTVLGPGTIVRTGYNFVGWNTVANGSGSAYLPGSMFAISGNVTLYAQWQCVSPTADAGGPYTTCQTDPVSLSGSATDYASVTWSSNGTGSFTNGNSLSATYQPSASDVTAGSVTLTLTADPLDSCASQAQDNAVLTFNPTFTYYLDSDGDGYGIASSTITTCSMSTPSGYAAEAGDCDDNNPAVNPGATEVCNGIDDDCNGLVDDGLPLFTYYVDGDGDGYGVTGNSILICSSTPPSGYSALGGDCDDGDAAVNPGAAEICNGIDDDCNGLVDDGLPVYTFYPDADGDGYGVMAGSITICNPTPPSGYVAAAGDCDDGNPAVYPGATEVCNGIDDDCNGLVDDGLPTYTYYLDADGDGYGVSSNSITSCQTSPPAGYAAQAGDCNDANAAVNPGATEICNGIDDDCDGLIDEGGVCQARLVLNGPTACLKANQAFQVTLTMADLNGFPAAGFQAFLHFDPNVISFVSGAYTQQPFGLPIITPITATADGDIDLAAGIDQLNGQTPTSADAVLAVLNFETIDVSVCGSQAPVVFRSHNPPTRVTNSSGQPVLNMSLIDAGAVVIDAHAPEISGCPLPEINVYSDPGQCGASASSVNLMPPLANDDCSGVVAVVGTVNGGPLPATYPVGTTTVVWTATDNCGNATACEQSVIVSANNQVVLDVQLSPTVVVGIMRCITFEFFDCSGNTSYETSQLVTFGAGGLATGVNVLVPCDEGPFTCVAARDPLHTLRRTSPLTVSGGNYVASFTGGKSLTGGNLNDDEYIDILDFGTFAGQFNQSLPPSTCATSAPHSDISGDGLVHTADFTFIQINFLKLADAPCCSVEMSPASSNPSFSTNKPGPELKGPITRISVVELWTRGLGQLTVADLNSDGWLDQADIAAFLNGALPQHLSVFASNRVGSWFNAANWGNTVLPNEHSSVVIPGGSRVTIDRADAVAHDVKAQTGATITLNRDGSLFASSMTISAGATLVLDDARCLLNVQNLILESGSTLVFKAGTIQIDGGTLIMPQGDLRVGDSSALSTLRLINGANAVVNGRTLVALKAGSRGSIEIEGGTLATGSLQVGVNGLAVVRLFDDAVVESASISVGEYGTIEGHGTLDGSIDNGGRIAPDGSGRIEITGDLIQRAGGSIEIELDDPISASVIVHGNVVLDGHLVLRVLVPFVPDVGTRFNLIAAVGDGTISQGFTTVILPDLGVDRVFTIEYELNNVNAIVEELHSN